VNAWELGSDGRYRRRKPRGRQAAHSAQQQLMEVLGMDAAPDQPNKESEQAK
jgi:polyphosphate kinase